MCSLDELKCVSAVSNQVPTKEERLWNSISKKMKKFKETSAVNDNPRSDRPHVSEETVAFVKETFEVSPKNSLIKVSLKLETCEN